MLDDSDIKIFTSKKEDNDGSDLFAVAEEMKKHIANGNFSKAKELGKKLADISPDSNDLSDELTAMLSAPSVTLDIKIQLKVLMLFCAEYALFKELCPLLATCANEAMYNKIRKDSAAFYEGISNGAAMSFYYMAIKQREISKAIGESFAMLCNAENNATIKALGSKTFELILCHIKEQISKAAFEA